MQQHFDLLHITRENLLSAIEGLSLQTLNEIPKGFNNNIIWNVGHCLIVQQLLYYRLSKLKYYVEPLWIDKYSKGSRPAEAIEQEEVDIIKRQLIESIDWARRDYENKIFETYHTYTTSFNATLTNIEDAIVFNNIHEGLHLGYVMALKKALY